MSVPGSSVRALVAVLAAVLAGVLAFGGAGAQALTGPRGFALRFGAEGSGPGQFSSEEGPAGVAVSEATHDVYVVDRGNDRVERFSSTGTYLGQFNGSGTYEVEGTTETGAPAAEGQFSLPSFIAVDNSANSLTDPSAGDVYVSDSGHHVIDKFSPTGEYLGDLTGPPSNGFTGVAGVAVDPTGNLWVSGSGEFEGANESVAFEFNNALENEFVTSWRSDGDSGGIAVNPVNDDVYVQAGGEAIRFSESLQFGSHLLEEEVDGVHFVKGLAIDEVSGDLLFDVGGSVQVFEAGGAAFASQPSFGSGELTAGRDLAVDSGSGAVYVADDGSDTVAKFSLLPAVRSEAPSALTATSATLEGTVDPNGETVTSCQFEYGTEAGVYPNTVPCEQAAGAGTTGVLVSAKVSGLVAGTVYHFRLAASHATGGFSYGEDEVVPAAPVIANEWVTDVTSGSATLSAEIDPNGGDTSYEFQYGPSEAYGSLAPVPAGDAGSGLGDTEVSVHLQGLDPGAIYHFRILASNAASSQPIAGEDRTLTTQLAGGELTLPDGRQWELVSPPDKHGADLAPPGSEGNLTQASEDGGAITYSSSAPIEQEPGGNALEEQILSVRGAGGWSSRNIATPHNLAIGVGLGEGDEYRFFAPDLSAAIVDPHGPFTPLSSEATERTAYVRHDFSCEAAPADCYTPLVTAANVLPGAIFGGNIIFHGEVAFEDATSDLSHVILTTQEVLLVEKTPEGNPATIPNHLLYEWAGGRLQIVSVLPDGEAVRGHMGAAEGSVVQGGISSDGSRVVWWSEGHLYMRDVAHEHTVQLDAPEAGAPGGAGEARLEWVNSDGSIAFFEDGSQLTKSSPVGGGLYECEMVEEVSGTLSCDLSYLTAPGALLGASEDGSYLYFISSKVLAEVKNGEGEEAAEGEANLYMLHHDNAGKSWEAPVFVARLSEADRPDSSNERPKHTAKASPNGEYLTFMSNRSLTGYDNHDAISGEADEEVYLYGAKSNTLVCVSCEPTGARPTGTVGGGRMVEGDRWEGKGIAATLPGWSPITGGLGLYQRRDLSDSGRLFFNSDDPLVPEDADGTWDVYEYEPPGVGGCTTSGVTFSSRSGGCVSLISSGTSSAESGFLDASASDDDVFFLTAERLTAQDDDDSFDVYDAHACFTAVPCVSAPVAAPPCDTSDSCKAAPTPQPPIFGAPASATFSGSGNVVSSPPVPVVAAPRRLTGAQKLARALRACRRKAKRKRVVCEGRARRQYGAAARSRKANTTKKGHR